MEIEKILAENLRRLREEQNFTQDSLASKSGVPRSSLATIESGAGNPSVSSLIKIARALQVSLDELISKPRPRIQLIKKNDIKSNTRSGGQVVQYKLLPDPIHGMEIDKIELQPKALMKGIPHIRHTREYLSCIEGEIILSCEGEKFHLYRGDLLAFPGDVPHSYYNPTDRIALCFSTVVIARV